MPFTTYTPGFTLAVSTKITKTNMVDICYELAAALGTGNEFKPEPSNNGFIHWTKWPNKDDMGYKCIRLYPVDHILRNTYYWPWIAPDVMQRWENDSTTLVPQGNYITFLKAIGSAPMWTTNELTAIARVLAAHGMRAAHMPTQHKLDFNRKCTYNA